MAVATRGGRFAGTLGSVMEFAMLLKICAVVVMMLGAGTLGILLGHCAGLGGDLYGSPGLAVQAHRHSLWMWGSVVVLCCVAMSVPFILVQAGIISDSCLLCSD